MMRTLLIIAAGMLFSLSSCDKNDDTAAVPGGGTSVAGQNATITSTSLVGNYKIERYLMNGGEQEQMREKELEFTREGLATLSSGSILFTGYWKLSGKGTTLAIEVPADSPNDYWSGLLVSDTWKVVFADGLYLELQSSWAGADRKMTLRKLEPEPNQRSLSANAAPISDYFIK